MLLLHLSYRRDICAQNDVLKMNFERSCMDGCEWSLRDRVNLQRMGDLLSSVSGMVYSYDRSRMRLPFAWAAILSSALLRPFKKWLPASLLFLTDRPALDTAIADVVYSQALDTDAKEVVIVDNFTASGADKKLA